MLDSQHFRINQNFKILFFWLIWKSRLIFTRLLLTLALSNVTFWNSLKCYLIGYAYLIVESRWSIKNLNVFDICGNSIMNHQRIFSLFLFSFQLAPNYTTFQSTKGKKNGWLRQSYLQIWIYFLITLALLWKKYVYSVMNHQGV